MSAFFEEEKKAYIPVTQSLNPRNFPLVLAYHSIYEATIQ